MTQQPKWFGLAVQALVILSNEQMRSSCSSSELAVYLQTDSSLLRRILAVLAKEGFLETRVGRDGGYRLCKPRESISLAEVYDVFLEGSPICFGIENTAGTNAFGLGMKSTLGHIALEMNSSLRDVLGKYTIANVADRLE